MALTEYQRRICRIIAQNRVSQGESYVAGGVALNSLIGGARVSRDIDLFASTKTTTTITAKESADSIFLQAPLVRRRRNPDLSAPMKVATAEP